MALRRCPPCVAMLLLLAAGTTLRAQQDSGGAPRSANGAYTVEQADRGAGVFRAVCAQCHVVSQFADGAFRRAWTGRPALELFELLRTRMPDDNPGRLRRQEYADLVAYLFKLGGVPAGPTEMTTDSASLRRIVFQPVPAPDPRE